MSTANCIVCGSPFERRNSRTLACGAVCSRVRAVERERARQGCEPLPGRVGSTSRDGIDYEAPTLPRGKSPEEVFAEVFEAAGQDYGGRFAPGADLQRTG